MTKSSTQRAFTLVELMVSTVVLGLIVLMLASMTNQTASTWQYTTGKIEQFSGARSGFESITRQLGQATLNTYYDYYDASGETRTAANADTFVPKNYGRKSELRFISGSMDRTNLYNGQSEPALAADTTRPRPTHGVFFHAPLGKVDDQAAHGGLEALLNCWGFYVEFNSDEQERPTFLQGASATAPLRWRYRLMQFMQSSEQLKTYSTPTDWFRTAVNLPAAPADPDNSPSSYVLAENIVALILQPALSPKDEALLNPVPSVPGTALAPSYFYDSTKKNPIGALNPQNQLPPNVRVTMVAIDEPSAIRLASGSTMPDFGLANLFKTNDAAGASSYEQDLTTLENNLAAKKCSFRVFTTNVVIRGAKWSKQ